MYALLSSAFYAIAETLDNFFVNKKFKHPLTLVFYSSLFNLLYIPIFFAFTRPEIPPIETYPLFFLLGVMGVGYLWPYYRGLQSEDTSVAIAFLAIERIMVVALAFLVVGEVLNFNQYLGIAIIIGSVILLGLHHSRAQFKMSKGVWYISWAALFLAGEAVILKLLFERGVSVATAVTGEALMSLILGISIIGLVRVRKDVVHSIPMFLALSPVFLVEELFTFLGLVSESFAISRTSVSVVKGVTMASPFFIVLYAWLGYSFFPKIFKEDLHRKKVIKKLLLFALLIIGIILVRE